MNEDPWIHNLNYSDMSGQAQCPASLPSDKQPVELVMNLQQAKKLLSLKEIEVSHPGCSIAIILIEVLQCISRNVLKL
jgi:hypothetical protein